MSNVFAVSAAPHIKQRISVSSVMWQVAAALMPALLAGIFFFGIQSLLLTLYSVTAAVLTEFILKDVIPNFRDYIYNLVSFVLNIRIYILKAIGNKTIPLLRFKKNNKITVSDGSAVVTGILVAFNINAASPWWLPVVGSVFAIAIGKQIFGGLGFNIFNPALLGRAFLVASWPTLTTAGWTKTQPLWNSFQSSINGLKNLPTNVPDVVTSATPLAVVKALRDTTQVSADMAETVMNNLASFTTIRELFWGNIGGVIGEVSAAALLIGAAYLAWKHIIEWRIPISYIGTVFILTYIFGGINGLFSASILLPIFHIFSGGLILGAFFMATDMVTSPVTKKGRIYFGIGCGLLTVVIRLVGGYPEGVSYSILLMNMVVPLIDKYTVPKIFGANNLNAD